MRPTWRTEWVQWLFIAAMFVLAAVSWNHVPDRLPVHWNLKGDVDGYGGRFEGLLSIPLLAVLMYLLLLFLPRIDPGRENYARFAGPYHAIRNLLIVFLAALYGIMHMGFRDQSLRMTSLILPLVGTLLVFMGNFMGKLRPNWFVGIRTPWTLTSKQSWVRSHRLGGWVFIFGGLGLFVAGLVGSSWALTLALALFLTGVFVVLVYSWWVWRNDPDKTPPAGTRPA